MRYALILTPFLTMLAGCTMMPDHGNRPYPPGPPDRPRPPDGPRPPERPGMTTLSGTATYRQRIALPRDAVLTVRISDVGRMDAPSRTVAETTTPTRGRQVPLPFTLRYDRKDIDPRGRYSVSARITDPRGRLLWTTDTNMPLPPPGRPITLQLVQAGGE